MSNSIKSPKLKLVITNGQTEISPNKLNETGLTLGGKC